MIIITEKQLKNIRTLVHIYYMLVKNNFTIMKKHLPNLSLFSLLLMLLLSHATRAQVFITELADPNNNASARFVELYNAGAAPFDLAANNYALLRYTNGNTSPQTAVPLTGTIPAGGFYIISPNGAAFNTAYGFAADQDIGTGGAADSNGDDQILLIDNTDNLNPITIDIFGVIGEDGTGTGHEFEDGRAERKGTVTSGNTTWDVNEWNVDNDSGGGNGIQNAPADFDPGSWIGVPSCTAPTTQASAINFTAIGDNAMTINWTGGDGDDGVIVLAKQGTAVDADPVSGTSYTANAAFGTGDEIGTGNYVVYVGGAAGADNVAVTSLAAGTTYHFAVYELNATNVCYLTPGLTGSQATTISTDTDSDITAPTTQVAAGSVASIANDFASAVNVFSFKLTDAGTADGVATDVQTIVIEKGSNNTVADWSAVIAGAKLNDGSNDLTITGTTINADNITFDLTGNEYSIADGTSAELTLAIFLNTTVTDQDVLEFEIPASHSFTANSSNSVFKTTLTAAVTSNQQTIEVTATTFDGSSASTFVINKNFKLYLAAKDANGNIDTAPRNVSVSLASGTGTLASATGLTGQPMVNGEITWTDLTYNTVEDITIKADDDGSALTITSPSPIPVKGNLYYEEYFNYADATTLESTAAWSNHSGTVGQMQVFTPGLSYPGYPNTGTGAAAKIMEGNSEDVSSGEAILYDGSVYVAALVNVSGTTKPDASGEYFLHTRQESGSFGNRIYVKDDAGILRFGITKSSGSVEYLTTDFNYDQTYLIVFKYTFNTGAGNDDVMDFWVNPALGISEPAPDYTHSATVTDVADIKQIALRQSGGTGNVLVDGIRMATTWDDLLPLNCTLPTTQASAITFGTTNANSMVVNWTAGNGDKSLVVVKEGSPVDINPVVGTDYTSATAVFSDAVVDLGGGNIVVYANDNTTQTVNVTGLTQGTTYHVAVYEYNASGFCYNTTGPATGSQATTTPNDSDSDITAPTTQVAAGAVASTANDIASAADVFTFKVTDAGTADAQPTALKTIVVEKGANNTVADWSAVIAGAKLNDGTNDLAVTGITINADNITFDLTGNEYNIADGASAELTLAIYLATTVTDQEVLEFEIPASHSFATLASGSGLKSTLGAAITSNQQTIEVTATTFTINAPVSTPPATNFSVTATAVDANGNTDVVARNVTLSRNAGTGTLSSVTGLGPVAMTSGVYTWSDVQHDTEETITVDVTDGTITATSGNIGIATVTGGVFISEYIEGSSNNKAIEIYNNTGTTIDLANYKVGLYGNGSGTIGNNLVLSDVAPTLAAGGVIVITNASATDANITAASDITSDVTFFNGDDAIALLENDVVIDVIGEIGNDPGSAWDVAGVTGGTRDHTLVRKSSITEGNPTNLASFGTNTSDSEWDVLAQDVTTNLGSHTVDVAGSPIISFDASVFNGDFGPLANGSASSSSSFSVSGTDLTADITVTAPTGFTVSLDDATFTSSITIAQSGGTANATTVYARFEPNALQVFSGNITLASTGANDKTIAVSGTGISAASLFYEGFDTCPSNSMITYSAASNRNWDCTSNTETSTGNAAYISGFGADVASDDWLVTPAIDLSSATNASLSFSSWTQYADASYPPLKVMASTDYSGSGDPTGATWTELTVVLSGENSQTWKASGDIDLQTYVGGSVYIAFHYTSSGTGSGQTANWAIDNISVEDKVAGPTVAVNDSGFNGNFGNVPFGTNSEIRSYQVSGTNLTADITITPPSSFEVSTTNDFSANVGTSSTPLTLAQTSGEVANTTIYVRFVPDAADGATDSGDIVHSSTGATDQTLAVTGTEGAATVVAISTIRPVDANGEPTKIGDEVTVKGQMIGFNSRSTGFQFAINDGTGGVVVRETTGNISTETFTEGDEVQVTGTVDFYNGTTQLLVTAISKVSSGNARPAATTVTALGESTEQELVKLENVTITDKTQWMGASDYSGSGFNLDITFGDGSATGTLRIEDDGNLHLKTYDEVFGSATSEITLVGLGAQFDSSSPYDAGYQVLVYQASDITTTTATPGFTIDQTGYNGTFGDIAAGEVSDATSYKVNGTQITGDFTITIPEGFEASLTSDFSNKVGNSTLPLSITPTNGNIDNITVYVRFAPQAAGNFSGNLVNAAAGYANVNLAVSGTGVENPTLGINDLEKYHVAVYPNPAESQLHIEIPASFGEGRIKLMQLNGAVVKQQSIGLAQQMDVSTLPKGVYILQIKSAKSLLSVRVNIR